MISKWPTYSQEEIMKVTSLLKSGKVNSSLFVDGNRIGIPQRVLAELIRIYS